MKNKCRAKIVKCYMVELGFFSGKCLGFEINVDKLQLTVKREESDFKWLLESLKKEYPYASIPFLLKSHIRVPYNNLY